MASNVPLKLRKQMLQMRAAVERIELAHHMIDVRSAANLSAIVRNAMPGDRSRSVASRLFDLVKRYPFFASAVSLVARRFKFPLFKLATKLGGVAAVGYKLWGFWQRQRAVNATSPRERVPRSRRLR